MQGERWEPVGFWLGGRYWPPIAGGAEEAETDPAGGDEAAGRLAELQERIADLTRAADESAAALEAERREHDEARLRGLDHYRRALIAEHGASAVQELIQGSTEELLDASVEVARAAFTRIQEQLQADATATITMTIPAGAGARTSQDVDGLSPVAKIARGLAK